ncbi:MAG: hypothetical protein VCB25_07010, partial [Myxococcota bacterium]
GYIFSKGEDKDGISVVQRWLHWHMKYGPAEKKKFETMLEVPLAGGQGEFFCSASRKKFAQMNPVISRSGFCSENFDLKAIRRTEFDKAFAESVPDHAVADHHDALSLQLPRTLASLIFQPCHLAIPKTKKWRPSKRLVSLGGANAFDRASWNQPISRKTARP